jgi:hypothetical protein
MDIFEQSQDFVFKGADTAKPLKKPISVVILTTRLDAKQEKAPTVKKMQDKSELIGFKCIIIDTAQGEIERNQEGNYFIRNKGSKKKYEINARLKYTD